MRISKSFVVLLIGLSIVLGCQRDDICIDGDTPLLIINFRDVNNPDDAKIVPSLRVNAIINPDSTAIVDTFADRAGLDSIAIPLRTDLTSTQFIFIINSGSTDEMAAENIDTLTVNYENGVQFVSRACGFVANYNNLTLDRTDDESNWIQNFMIELESVQSTTTPATHVTIFH